VTASARAPLLGAVLALAIAVRLVNVWIASRSPLAEYQLVWQEGDMATSWTWSGKILAGDVLGRDTPHQYTAWMRDWAPLETWGRWWGGRTIFHQGPLYAYALAGMRLVAGDRFVGVALCQAALGVVNVALVFLLAARLFGGAVPAIAAAGAAVYGPFLFHETVVLRDVLGVTVSLLLLWWLARSDDERLLRWLVAGALFALAVLARETTSVALFVALLIVRRFWGLALGTPGSRSRPASRPGSRRSWPGTSWSGVAARAPRRARSRPSSTGTRSTAPGSASRSPRRRGRSWSRPTAGSGRRSA
jgi:hypothetical protein